MSEPQYAVVRDPLFTFMLSRYGTYFTITPVSGYIIDGVGNQIDMLSRSVEIKTLDYNTSTIVQSGIIKIDETTAVRRIVMRDAVRDTYCPGGWCLDDCWSFEDVSFDAFVEDVVLNPGYYIVVVSVTVQSGIFTVQAR